MIAHVVGVRPNYVKAAPLINNLNNVDQVVINTGQHYDKILSDDIIKSLGMTRPDVNLGVSGDNGVFNRLGSLMESLADTLSTYNPSLLVVYGDVDSTLAASIVASRLGIPVAHVESGLRSFDNRMPEEINRKIVDSIADLHFATEPSAVENLENEGITKTVRLVGNSMIDSLVKVIKSESFKSSPYDNQKNVLLTCHRQSNVDNKNNLEEILRMCSGIDKKIVFPVHPRTRNKMKQFGVYQEFKHLRNLELIDPLDYCNFLKMMNTSSVVITDSGGIQEETTFLGIPCLTIRKNTERPSTVMYGTNTLVCFNEVSHYIDQINNFRYKTHKVLENWDGKAGERIASHIREYLG